jgi:glycosyltransferase involved in cell wall biosynthesis
MPGKLPHIIFTVTNDLTYDRRMDRICSTLASNGYAVTLVGRRLKNSLPLASSPWKGVRLKCWFNKGFLFYKEYNLRLFFWLLPKTFIAICACDLDTALPVSLVSWLRRKKSVLDAHEYFTEVPEVVSRPRVKAVWEWIAKVTIPKFKLRYTVGEELARLMSEQYHVPFQVIRNIAPHPYAPTASTDLFQRDKIILYQGALNIGRGLEILLESMKQLPDWSLWLAGEGDISKQLQTYSIQNNLEDRVHFLGWVKPDELPGLMAKARLGINLREKGSLNDYYSLPNKFFDCIHAGLPCINMKYPEYEKISERYACSILLEHLNVETLVQVIHQLDAQPEKLMAMAKECQKAALELTWEKEAKKLVQLYRDLISN